MKSRKFEFTPVTEPKPGCGLTVYWDWAIRKYGRGLIKEALQGHQDDMLEDPWGNGEFK